MPDRGEGMEKRGQGLSHLKAWNASRAYRGCQFIEIVGLSGEDRASFEQVERSQGCFSHMGCWIPRGSTSQSLDRFVITERTEMHRTKVADAFVFVLETAA